MNINGFPVLTYKDLIHRASQQERITGVRYVVGHLQDPFVTAIATLPNGIDIEQSIRWSDVELEYKPDTVTSDMDRVEALKARAVTKLIRSSFPSILKQ